ncbi:DUF6538 domain-containing protein [Oleiagrimonas sp. MCCC 1A03011]|uniref:DUF6538 domain-containing protein n=1 Tax=Oleiagrimonas sp. MCCC 1A03011 TaxID=1926883 RepID=UPI000DC5E78D|nr:DUF6538 domain-containing protein [Oleiagrimonas sp. MCCC 1A03011]RAP59671.1 hypothetical protein BTJ49_03255 [Oleiagrimonas sp. MCCC 1A03011]
MRLPHHLIYRPSGFTFRLIVPADLRSQVGKVVISRSLRTHDRTRAQVFALALASQYAQTFRELRGQDVAEKDAPIVDTIVDAFGEGKVRPYEIDLEKGIVRTDGSDKEHERAMAAMDKAGKLRAQMPVQAVPVAANAQPLAPAVKAGMPLHKAIRDYSDVEGPNLHSNTWTGRQRALRSFAKAVGANTPITTITRPMAADWANDLVRSGVSKRTAVNYVSNVAQIFAYLMRQGHLTNNPVKGVMVMSKREKAKRRAEGHEWEAFSVDQLKRIYAPENIATMTLLHNRWAAMLGLYTGARVGEVAQIFLRDIVKEGDIWCVRLTVESDGQALKTEHSKRLVPLHPDLIALGFTEYVSRLRKMGEERLFPHVNLNGKAGKGSGISKNFGYLLKRKGVAVKPRREHGRVGFHSLRKTVVQSLQGTGVSDERRRAFVGHEQSDDVHATVYMRAWTAEELSSLWAGLKWGEWLRMDELRALLV